MCLRLIYIVLLVTSVLSRHVPNFSELDEDEQHLYRAAGYDAPAYNQEQEYEEDLPAGKLDLVKDGLWALKAKLKELKAFNKALAANMLATKLSIKELLKNHMGPVKQHHHEKPAYSYAPAPPAYHVPAAAAYPAPAYPQYEAPAPVAGPQYGAAPAYHDAYAPIPAPQYRHEHEHHGL